MNPLIHNQNYHSHQMVIVCYKTMALCNRYKSATLLQDFSRLLCYPDIGLAQITSSQTTASLYVLLTQDQALKPNYMPNMAIFCHF